MAKILFGKSDFNLNPKKQETTKFVKANTQDFYKKRSKKYMEIIAGLDDESLTKTRGFDDFMEIIQEEFGTAELSSLPQGIVSKCFLGHPYEVHILDLVGNQILKHYKSGQSMEPSFEKARNLAMHHMYDIVEVYTDKIILIKSDGSTIKYT